MTRYAESGVSANSNTEAGAAIKRGVAVTLNSSGKIVPADNNHICLGISARAVSSGEVAVYYNGGIVNALAKGDGTAIAVGDYVGPGGSDGILTKKSTAGDVIVGVARSATSSAAGTIQVEIQFHSIATVTI